MAAVNPLPHDSARRFDQRVARLTLVLGGLLAVFAGFGYSRRAGAGVVIGTLLAWVNFRWLEQASEAITRLAKAQVGAERPQISPWTWAKFFARYGLIALVLYAIVAGSPIPPVSVLGGLLMLGAAAMAVGLYEVLVETR